MHYRECPNCGALIDPEERFDCGGPVFRLRVGSAVKLIDQATFMDFLHKMKMYRTESEQRKSLIEAATKP
jgi:hypothetical protein